MLKGCPFCGGKGKIRTFYNSSGKCIVDIECLNCGSRGALFAVDDYISSDTTAFEEAQKAWNNRVDGGTK